MHLGVGTTRAAVTSPRTGTTLGFAMGDALLNDQSIFLKVTRWLHVSNKWGIFGVASESP